MLFTAWMQFVLESLYFYVASVIFHLGGFPACHATLNCGQTGCPPNEQLRAIRLARKQQDGSMYVC
jgi:hypothetical protein